MLNSLLPKSSRLDVDSVSRCDFHPFKAVAIDLDGTLLSHDRTISEANHAAINELHASGVEIILASGRHHISMLPFARQLPLVKWMVSSQGAFASDLDRKTVLYNSHLPADKAATMIDIGLDQQYAVVVYTKNGIFCLNEGEWTDFYVQLSGIKPTLISREAILNDSIFKVVFIGPEESLEAAEDLAGIQAWDLYKVRSMKNVLEFAGLGTSKAHGLKPLLAHLGINVSQLATFGDALNDIPMFEIAGYSVAMDTGWEEAKAAAHAVTPVGPPESAFARAVTMLRFVSRAENFMNKEFASGSRQEEKNEPNKTRSFD
jgi:Cof subfamily protein (haloacid dehalogenase superfamily)